MYAHTFACSSDTFSSLQPTYFPGFAFSWMSLISHRLFMPKLLLSDNREVRLTYDIVTCMTKTYAQTCRVGLRSTSFCSRYSSSLRHSLKRPTYNPLGATSTAEPSVYSLSFCTTSLSSSANTTSHCATLSPHVAFSSAISFSVHTLPMSSFPTPISVTSTSS